VITAFLQEEGMSLTDKKELNDKDISSVSAEIICLIKYGEYPSGSHVIFPFILLVTLRNFSAENCMSFSFISDLTLIGKSGNIPLSLTITELK